MERLTGLDSAFLSFESPSIHLHILGALIFDPSGVEGGVDFARVRETVAARLHLVPPFRRRVVEVPLGLQHPALVDDPDFDIDYHVRRVALPKPGGSVELAELVADIASRPLDRRRPLWEFHVVEGLAHGRLALVPKVHHAILDGVSGAEVMAAFLDLSPHPAPRPLFAAPRQAARRTRWSDGGSAAGRARTEQGRGPGGRKLSEVGPQEPPGWAPAPLPGEIAKWRDVLGSLPSQADTLVRTVSRTVLGARARSGSRRGEGSDAVMPAPFEAPATSINRAISPHRRAAFAELPMSQIQRVREILGGTTNDVVLTVAAGGMRRFFAGRGEELAHPLVALVPVSVRAESERDALGNRVSAMLVSLATGEADEAERLARIRRDVGTAKEQDRIFEPGVVAGWAQAALPMIAARLSRLAGNLRVFDHLPPPFNLIVSNVPGPDFPLYLAGARMVSMYPLGPIFEGAGVNITVFSYLDTVYVGVQGCWDLVPDVAGIANGMCESLRELVSATNRLVRPVPWWHAEVPA